MRVLVVEDNPDIREQINRKLQSRYIIDTADNQERGEYLFYVNDYQLVILDLGLPDASGLRLLQIIRQEKFAYPILILSGYTSPFDVKKGLEFGADDYLTKPFSLVELEARVNNLLNRRKSLRANAAYLADSSPRNPKNCSTITSNAIQLGKLSFDLHQKSLRYEDQPINLTKKEALILECLLRRRKYITNKQTLIAHAWQEAYVRSNTLQVHINRLRHKIDYNLGIDLIETVRGRGYTINQALLQAESGVNETEEIESDPD
jgi:DNA-binding response OmpR family regulator